MGATQPFEALGTGRVWDDAAMPKWVAHAEKKRMWRLVSVQGSGDSGLTMREMRRCGGDVRGGWAFDVLGGFGG